ncbi:MAG TPA: sugar phosphate isomerase/epimerase family protein [Planctomycetota bacterium]|jgi:hexulose-6-phosphate isomerase|nr:sugar phosphate isomerase/epimerase [Planctomycetota bacterium]NMD36511.1 sugar phosphate isomerase/epimerase [Planctomycetota bacterium]HNR98223.1 sugar phosphate isomerase/epimerase family protein [Planctomycetota bacterium]HNU24908.1 sugar phosphate isomerase/epimerase family protein [Planctomycetota bacterium]HOE29510.1 sugar phosphate isomerase/epimerase family protein [Planctomycetota bacterium]
MKPSLNRRDFIAVTSSLAAAAALTRPARAAEAAPSAFKTVLKKAMIVGGAPTAAQLEEFKAAGFDGVEAGVAGLEEAAASRRAAEKLGMRVHSVLRGWAEFNSDDPRKFEDSFAATEKALRAAQAFGADAVLLVPCRIGGMPMPRAWEFLIDFDPANGRIRRVTAGDNGPFKAYIDAHNHATETSREAVKRLIPLAERCGVVIALENVWNNLWVQPAIFRNFIASFQSPWVKAYFDIANHVKYGHPEEWILTLDELLAKLHVKEFKINPADPRGEGEWPQIRDGSVRWPVVRHALERVNYNGWLTIEDGRLPLEELSKRLDLIIAGK